MKQVAKYIFAFVSGVVVTLLFLFYVLFGTYYHSRTFEGGIEYIGLEGSRKIKHEFLIWPDDISHYKFQATKDEVDKIISTLDLEVTQNPPFRSRRDPFFFYPWFESHFTYFGIGGAHDHIKYYLYYYPETERVYFVNYDP